MHQEEEPGSTIQRRKNFLRLLSRLELESYARTAVHITAVTLHVQLVQTRFTKSTVQATRQSCITAVVDTLDPARL